MHIKGVTECFECQPKPTPKTYPVCTIRNTPDKPIHCIVWAKDLLFATLFGPQMASDLEEAEQPVEGDEDAELAKETAEVRACRPRTTPRPKVLTACACAGGCRARRLFPPARQ